MISVAGIGIRGGSYEDESSSSSDSNIGALKSEDDDESELSPNTN